MSRRGIDSGAAGSAYGSASSLITLLLWVYYSSQILLFGAEFTQVYADRAGREVKPDEYAVRVEEKEIETREHLALTTFFSAIHMRPQDNPAEDSLILRSLATLPLSAVSVLFGVSAASQ